MYVVGKWLDVAWAEANLRTKWHLDPSSHLATTDMGRNWRGLCPFGGGELGPYVTHGREIGLGSGYIV